MTPAITIVDTPQEPPVRPNRQISGNVSTNPNQARLNREPLDENFNDAQDDGGPE